MLLKLGRRWRLIMAHLQRNKMIIESNRSRRWHLILCNVPYTRLPKNAMRL